MNTPRLTMSEVMKKAPLSYEEIYEAALDSASYFFKTGDMNKAIPAIRGETIQDVAQDVCSKLFESNAVPRTKAFVGCSTRNLCIDKLRKRKLDIAEFDTIHDNRVASEILDIKDIFYSLTVADQYLYTMKDTDVPEEDMAIVLGCKPRTVRRRYTILKANITKLLEDNDL